MPPTPICLTAMDEIDREILRALSQDARISYRELGARVDDRRGLSSPNPMPRRTHMELRRLGRSGLKVSALSLGAMTFGESQTFMKGVTSTDDEARRVFDRAVDAGINLVDTANVYSEGKSEEP